MRFAIIALCACLLSGCLWSSKVTLGDTQTETLELLPAAQMPAAEIIPNSSLSQIAEGYRSALALIDDGQTRENILRRLALIDLRAAEERQIIDSASSAKAIYRDAITTYELLLQQQSARQDSDQLLYPLAKAYDMSGDSQSALQVFSRLVSEFPQSIYYSESQFRRAEILFATANYAAAAKAYSAVVTRAEESPFLHNARYMQGWSEFKLARYAKALRAFIAVLDVYLSSDRKEQSDADVELIDDTFRVMSLAFSNLQGAESIARLLQSTGERPYREQLYQNLGELYLDKKRFVDSAETYLAYIERYPQSAQAPHFHQHAIDAYAAGQFPEQLREQKRSFASHYSVAGNYWLSANAETQAFIKQRLRIYINELASYYHSLAQRQQKKMLNSTSEDVEAADPQSIRQLFREAGDWYQQWIESFPQDSDLAASWFLLAETRYESADYQDAIIAYEMAAYGRAVSIENQSILDESISVENSTSDSLVIEGRPVDRGFVGSDFVDSSFVDSSFEKADEAGYAALLAYDQTIEKILKRSTAEAEVDGWRMKKIHSALLFAKIFAQDSRRDSVLAQTVQSLLAMQQYSMTIEVAELLLQSASLTTDLRLTAWLSAAHASVALDQQQDAERSYAEAIAILAADEGSTHYQRYYRQTLDNYAASIYRQGEQLQASGQYVAAAATFLRVVSEAAESAIRVNAQHDATVLLMQTEQWAVAIEVMSDFQTRFSSHSESASIPARLLEARRGMGDWLGAAEQALSIASNDPDALTRQEALYTAAELFDKAGDSSNAIDKYRSYAHKYAEPLAQRMEAQNRLAELYQALANSDSAAVPKRRYWLKKMIASHADAKTKTPRSTYLAAFSSSELAEESFQRYQRITLKHPLEKSLASKRKALTQAVESYQKAAAYGIDVYSTQATQRMGEIYAELASDLLDSERPSGLSELETEQYNFLLEEQAYPFEEQAIELFSVNVERAWQGLDTDWVRRSYQSLARLLPGRFDKEELRPE